MILPRILIAGTHSGVGKTTVTMALLLALQRGGLRVQAFKAGPDYIDPGYLTAVLGRPCRNLDRWLIPPGRLTELFARASAGADLAVIEGMMGLYDGIGSTGERGSTAELAKLFGTPVLLVLDVSALSRSAAAMVRGYVEFDPDLKIAGCFLNRVGGVGHYRLVKESIEKLTGVPVVGFLPRDERLILPERHLGLIPRQEGQNWKRILAPLAQRAREGVDLKAVERIAQSAQPLKFGVRRSEFVVKSFKTPGSKVPIGVAMDAAFHFYYPDNLEFLEEAGAQLVPFSPLNDAHLPQGVAALYLGGGFPEVFAAPLSKNRKLQGEIRQVIRSGMPTYAECGGLMYLTRSLIDTRGKRHSMVGLIPAQVQMTDRLQNFGYQQVRAHRNSLLARSGEKARGHEFHHSILSRAFLRSRAAYEAFPAGNGSKRLEGYAQGSLVASYIHLHFWNCPRWAKRFVKAARDFQQGKRGQK